ncbi:hypothetical protein LTR56_013395 [Elasticomyces elasticus]|nr:hypothetical protein LTR56_013395 [Elasticomyces elasticus]KAK3665708.1 hypothetical protein LTR22_003339 [Elasticomyces elasticus]KAK4910015.1 hypothetical protein LTR49_021289 [Elasticomyces elasticus]KAK5757254.1 hypothetical protein LTS12_012612 [Elasticomyces elasticus]
MPLASRKRVLAQRSPKDLVDSAVLQRMKVQKSDERQPTGFLGLPAEIRNSVYEYVFEDMVAPPDHPFGVLPSNKRCRMYMDLLRTNHQISSEAKSLFLHDYAARLTFYYANAVELVMDMDKMRSTNGHLFPHKVLRKALFVIAQHRTLPGGSRIDHTRGLREHTERLISCQPGFNSLWFNMPGFFGLGGDGVELSHGPRGSEFQRSAVKHDQCEKSDGCPTYAQLRWPMFNNGCQVMLYRWETSNPSLEAGPKVSCVVLEGCLGYVNISRYNRKTGAEALAHATSQTPSPETCVACKHLVAVPEVLDHWSSDEDSDEELDGRHSDHDSDGNDSSSDRSDSEGLESGLIGFEDVEDSDSDADDWRNENDY